MEPRTANETIVVGVDGSPTSLAALRWACREGEFRHAQVDAVHVVADRSGLGTGFGIFTEDGLLAEGKRYLRHALEGAGIDERAVVQSVRCGSPLLELQAEVDSLHPIMLVLGRKGFSRMSRLWVGSVTSAMAQDPALPVVVVPDEASVSDETIDHRRIVVGVDGSSCSTDALRWAVTEANARDAAIEVVVAWSIPHLELMPFAPTSMDNEPALRKRAREVLDAALLDAAALGATKAEGRLMKSHPIPALLQASDTADLIVVGSRGRGGLGRKVLGSTSHGLLHDCEVPLVIVPTGSQP